MYDANIKRWFATWYNHFSFPENYISIDLELTGPEPGDDLITEFGISVVRNRKEATRKTIVLDWSTDPDTDQEWLKEKMIEVGKYFAGKGTANYLTYKDLSTHPASTPAVYGLKAILQILQDTRKAKMFVIGHNIYSFDAEILREHFENFLNVFYEFGDNEIMDTGIMEKAIRLNMVPWPNQSLRSFSQRVDDRPLTGWKLSEHCIPKYGLVRKHNLDLTQAHNASYDAYLAHLLFEHYREEAERLGIHGRARNPEQRDILVDHKDAQASKGAKKPEVFS